MRTGSFLFLNLLLLAGIANAESHTSISAQDVNGKLVALNEPGHYTVVLYTNPDLEDATRKVTEVLDPYRSRSDITFVRVLDLRGGVPPDMRSIVKTEIRRQQAKEDVRLKKEGVASGDQAPIIPDFNGSTLDALGWDSIYDEVHLVIYDTHGHEIKRLKNANDPKQVAKVVEGMM